MATYRVPSLSTYGFQQPVIDKDTLTPPDSPAEGNRYLINGIGTGAWAGHNGKIAYYHNSAWAFDTPAEGWICWVKDENVFYVYDGSVWSNSLTLDHIHLATDLVVADGGTGASTFTDHGVLYGQAANSIGATAEGATGEYLAGATGGSPTWAVLNQAAVAGLTTASSPTWVGATLSGLTASVPVVTGASKELASVSYATFKASLAIAQADVSGLTTAASPTFVTVKCSGLTDGYIPYHVSDAGGLANGPIRTDGTYVGIGMAPTTSRMLEITGASNTAGIQITNSTDSKAFYLGTFNVYGSGNFSIDQAGVGQAFQIAHTTLDASFPTGKVFIGATSAVGSELFRCDGNAYFDHDVSALTFTDRP